MLFEILPPGPFGVPEDGRTVLPAQAGTYAGDAFHGALGIRAGYGALSRYRPDEEAIAADFELAGHPSQLRDNFLRVEVSADDHGGALALARDSVDSFVQHLGVAVGRSIIAVPLFVEGPNGDDRPAHTPFMLASVTMYNLRSLREQIGVAAKAAALTDDRLARAIGYFQHALWLFEQRAGIPNPYDSNSRLLIASVFLNLWKAASTVVGDPSTDGDYQRRYRELGFDHGFFKTRIEPLRRLRNDYDVAHYHLDPTAIEVVERQFGEASETVREILSRRTARLLQ